MNNTLNSKSLEEYFAAAITDNTGNTGLIESGGLDARLDVFNYAYGSDLQADEAPFVGTKSLFNEYSIFRYQGAAGDHNMLYDREDESGITEFASRNPSAGNIISWSLSDTGDYSAFGSAPYSYSDFLYCKYHGLIPNNYLITLRRYPIPMVDSLKTPDGKSIPPMAQAVTWFGGETGNSMKDILKFSLGQNWNEIESQVQEVPGNERGFDELAVFPGADQIKSVLGFMNPKDYSGQSQSESDYAKKMYGSEGPYANKEYGPVNVIDKTLVRKRGLKFDHEINLKFHYELKSIGNINPKAAILDLISNLLTLTYNNAKFWGGAVRYFPQYPRVRFLGDQNKFYGGDMGGYLDSVMQSVSKIKGGFMESFSKFLSNPLQALGELAKGGTQMMMGNIASRNRPEILSIRSLLTGDPVGEWHLVIGNPMNPIAMIGNLVCTNCEFEFSDDLGMDDFPSEMTVTINLKHGRPRDKGDIESMFNLGNGRMYYGIKDSDFSSAHNSIVDTSGKKGNKENVGKIADKPNNSIFTPAEMARLSDQSSLGNKKNMGSMWGKKFDLKQIEITSKWAGSAPAPPTKNTAS